MAKRGVTSGYHEETAKVSTLTAGVSDVRDGWTRGGHLQTTQVQRVSKIYSDLSNLISSYGSLAKKDASEFNKLGVKIEVEDREDAKR